MKSKFLTLVLICGMATIMTSCGNHPKQTEIPAPLVSTEKAAEAKESIEVAPDYSKKECWYRIPEITKDVDTYPHLKFAAGELDTGDIISFNTEGKKNRGLSKQGKVGKNGSEGWKGMGHKMT